MSARARAARQASWYEPYSGTGASRTISGSRKSATTSSASIAASRAGRVGQPDRQLRPAGRRVARGHDLGVGHQRLDRPSRGSAVSATDRSRSAVIPTSSNIASDTADRRERQDRGRRDRATRPRRAPDRWSPPSRTGSPASLPHQPASRRSGIDAAWRSWTNSWPSAPGPPLRYLYVHHAAKSTPASWRPSGTLPAPWARSQPAIAPASWIAPVRRSMSCSWPVA